MRFEVDDKHRIVDFYIEDEAGHEHHWGLTFKQTKEIVEDVVWRMNNPQEEG